MFQLPVRCLFLLGADKTALHMLLGSVQYRLTFMFRLDFRHGLPSCQD